LKQFNKEEEETHLNDKNKRDEKRREEKR